jgi:hypothetical protein
MFESFRERWRERATRRRTYERIRAELSQHSHRELYDLRIGPGDIDRIAWEGAYGVHAPSAAALRQGREQGAGAVPDLLPLFPR